MWKTSEPLGKKRWESSNKIIKNKRYRAVINVSLFFIYFHQQSNKQQASIEIENFRSRIYR